MTIPLNVIEGMKADMHDWFYEASDKVYTKYKKFYPDLAEILDVNDIKGGFWKGTSALGATELEDVGDGQAYAEDLPVDGFTVYGRIKQKGLKIQVPYDMKRDFAKGKDWLQGYIKENWSMNTIDMTKDKIVCAYYNKAGYTAGDSIFNQASARIGLVTGYSNDLLCYDGKPWANLSGNNRAAKYQTTGTYYNALALNGVTYANGLDMWNLLTATNNRNDAGAKFDNSRDVIIACHESLAPDWESVVESPLNPDNNSNKSNSLKKRVKKVIGVPHFDTTTFSSMFRKGMGLKVWFGEPKFNFWVKNDPETYLASIRIDYAATVQNWRTHVFNNAPAS